MEEAAIGLSEELIVELQDCVPMVKLPRQLLLDALVALSDNVHLRSNAVQDMVRELQSYVK